MLPEMEGHAMSLTSATTWARSEMANRERERTELVDSLRAYELGDPGTVDVTPTRGKTRSGNESYEVARWGQTLEGIGQERGEV